MVRILCACELKNHTHSEGSTLHEFDFLLTHNIPLQSGIAFLAISEIETSVPQGKKSGVFCLVQMLITFGGIACFYSEKIDALMPIGLIYYTFLLVSLLLSEIRHNTPKLHGFNYPRLKQCNCRSNKKCC